MQFSLISTRDIDPPIFTLNFEATNSPPTNVTCFINDTRLSINNYNISCKVIDGSRSRTNVTVTVKTRLSGTYKCSVSNIKGSANTKETIKGLYVYKVYLNIVKINLY